MDIKNLHIPVYWGNAENQGNYLQNLRVPYNS